METSPYRIALIGDYSPRQCGIATFTADLAEALASGIDEADVFAVAVNDRGEGYKYPPRVRFEFAERDSASYRRAADFLNINRVNIVCVQHEYGIYGGPSGSHILPLLKQLRMPIITTLHTVLKDPSPIQKKVLMELGKVSDRVVVMAHRAEEFLKEIYSVPPEKIDFIHHGIPDVPFADPNYHKDLFGVEGKTVLLTFGLLSPNKGIEYAIEALPSIIERYPNVVYLIQGATHPNLFASEGETYRMELQRLARVKGVESHVIFHNRFVTLEGARSVHQRGRPVHSSIPPPRSDGVGNAGLYARSGESHRFHSDMVCPGTVCGWTWSIGTRKRSWSTRRSGH